MDTVLEFLAARRLEAALILVLAILCFYLLRLLFDEEQAAVVRGAAYRALHEVTRKRSHEKAYISNDLRGRLNLARRQLHFGADVLPEAVKVEWVNAASGEALDIADGQFIVRLDPSSGQADNAVLLAQTIVKRTALQGLRHLAPASLCWSLDNALSRQLVLRLGKREIVEAFYRNAYQPPPADPENWWTVVAEVEDGGLLERMLLVELEELARRIQPLRPTEAIKQEVVGLVRWVHALAVKKEGEQAELNFIGPHLRASVVLVARMEKILEHGAAPYQEAVRRSVFRRGSDAVYVIIWSKGYLASRIQRFKYWKSCRLLKSSIEAIKGVEQTFAESYDYLNAAGQRRTGEITRYRISELARRSGAEGKFLELAGLAPEEIWQKGRVIRIEPTFGIINAEGQDFFLPKWLLEDAKHAPRIGDEVAFIPGPLTGSFSRRSVSQVMVIGSTALAHLLHSEEGGEALVEVRLGHESVAFLPATLGGGSRHVGSVCEVVIQWCEGAPSCSILKLES